MKHLTYMFFLCSVFFAPRIFAVTNKATAGTTWTAATWSQGHVPLSSEDVVIKSGVNLTINTAAVCGSLTIGDGTNRATTLTIQTGGSLAISGTSGNLIFNPNNVNRTFTLSVGAGTLSVAGSVTFSTTTTSTISLSTGTITFSNAITLGTADRITYSSTGTINFNGGLTDGSAGLTTRAGCTVNMGGNYTASGSPVTWNGTSNIIFTSNSTITPSAAITFGNLQINSSVAITLVGAIDVAGNWTNDGGTVSGAYDITFSGGNKTIGGTAGTAFPKGIILDNAARYTLATAHTYSATSLTINAGANATSLTHAGSAVLNISGNVTIYQSTGAVTRSWRINTGTATVSGTIVYVGTTATANYISHVIVTNGSLTANALSFAANSNNANQILSLTRGDITITNAYTLANGTVTLANNGTINFNGLITHTGGIIENTTTAGTINFAGGYNLSTGTFTTMAGETVRFGANFTNSRIGGTILNATSTSVFTANSTITPTTNITFGHFQVNTGAAVTLGGNISVAGNWAVNGTGSVNATSNSSKVTFSGASAKTVSGNSTDFYNIDVSTGASVTMSSDQRLIKTLTLNGTGAFNANNHFTLVSTSSNTANIAALATPANFTGNITMQRYVSGAMGYRYIGSAISGTTLSGLTPEIDLDGMTGGTRPTYWCNVYTYNESLAGAFANGWTAATNVTNPMSAGSGFAIYFYSVNIPVTLDLNGAPNTGNQSLPVTYTNTGNADDGWNLVSNPYPSSVDWDAVSGWTRSQIQGNAYYVWNDAAQNYASYPVGGPGVNSGTNVIASSQGFMVITNGASPALNMTENVKVSSNPTPQFWKAAAIPNPYAVRLKLSGSTNTFTDESVIRFMQGALTTKDLAEDALKLVSTNAAAPYMATLSTDSVSLCINTLPDFTGDAAIPVMIKAGVNGTYTIKAELLNQFPSASCLVLEDLLNGNTQDLKTGDYTFTMNTSPTPVKRFLLHVSTPALNLKTSNVTCNGQNNGTLIINGNGASSWSYLVVDSLNTTIASATNAVKPDTIKNLKIGTYTISTSGSSYCGTQTQTVTITQPNPFSATLSAADITCAGMNNGTLTVNATGGNPTYLYLWSNGATSIAVNNLSPGTYTVTVTDDEDCSTIVDSTINEGVVIKAGFVANKDTLYLNANDSIHFTNTTIGANTYVWDFGDNAGETSVNPTHTYFSAGTYTVNLRAYNLQGCSDSIQYSIVVLPSVPLNTSVKNSQNLFQVYSFNRSLILKCGTSNFSKLGVRVINQLGQEVFVSSRNQLQSNAVFVIDMSEQPNGVYFVQLIADEVQYSHKINYISQ